MTTAVTTTAMTTTAAFAARRLSQEGCKVQQDGYRNSERSGLRDAFLPTAFLPTAFMRQPSCREAAVALGAVIDPDISETPLHASRHLCVQ